MALEFEPGVMSKSAEYIAVNIQEWRRRASTDELTLDEMKEIIKHLSGARTADMVAKKKPTVREKKVKETAELQLSLDTELTDLFGE